MSEQDLGEEIVVVQHTFESSACFLGKLYTQTTEVILRQSNSLHCRDQDLDS